MGLEATPVGPNIKKKMVAPAPGSMYLRPGLGGGGKGFGFIPQPAAPSPSFAPSKKYPKIGQVTPGQGGLAVDPLNIQPLGLSSVTSPEPDLRRGPFPDGPIPRQPPISPHAPPVAGPLAQPPVAGGTPPQERAPGAPLNLQPLGLSSPASPPAQQVPAQPPGRPSPLAPATPPAQPPSLGLNPYTAQNPQNAGYAQLGNALHAQNSAVASRPPGPSYAQNLQSGAAPFSNPATGARYGAATELGLAGPISHFGSNVEADIAKARGIATQNNYRESMLADLNGVSRGMPKPPPEKNYRNMSDADRERIAARFPGGKFLPYGSEPNGAAGAMTKADADQIDATKVAGAQLGLAQGRRANGFEPSPGGMSPQEKYDMRQFDKREGARKLAADRQAGRVQTPRQMRNAAKAAEQQTAFERGLGPQSYAQLQGLREQGRIADLNRKSNEKIQSERNQTTKDIAGTQAGTHADKQYWDTYRELAKGGMSHGDIERRLGRAPTVGGGIGMPQVGGQPPTSPLAPPTPVPPPRVAQAPPASTPLAPSTPPAPSAGSPSPLTPAAPAVATPGPAALAPPKSAAARNKLGAREYDRTIGKTPYKPSTDLNDAQRAEIAKAGSHAEREQVMKKYGVHSNGDKAYYHQLGEPDQPALYGIPGALGTLYGSVGAHFMGKLGMGRGELAAPTRRVSGNRSVPVSKKSQGLSKQKAYSREVDKGLMR